MRENRLSVNHRYRESKTEDIYTYTETSVCEVDPVVILKAVNQMIDSAARRDAGLRNYVPESVLYMIIVVSLVVMGIIGYLSGITGGRSVTAVLLLAAVVALVLFVIMDFDRPYRGVITVSQQSMLDLRDLMELGPAPWIKGRPPWSS